MILRRSRFVHQVPVGPDRVLVVHAISHLRLPATLEIAALLDCFAEPRHVPDDLAALTALFSPSQQPDESLRDAVERTVMDLLARQILTDKTPADELATLGAELAPQHGRDPAEMLERYRQTRKEGAAAYWAVGTAQGLQDFAVSGPRLDAILLGDCDIQMEADFLRRDGSDDSMKDTASGDHIGFDAGLRAQDAGHVFGLCSGERCGGFIPVLGDPAAAGHGRTFHVLLLDSLNRFGHKVLRLTGGNSS